MQVLLVRPYFPKPIQNQESFQSPFHENYQHHLCPSEHAHQKLRINMHIQDYYYKRLLNIIETRESKTFLTNKALPLRPYPFQ